MSTLNNLDLYECRSRTRDDWQPIQMAEAMSTNYRREFRVTLRETFRRDAWLRFVWEGFPNPPLTIKSAVTFIDASAVAHAFTYNDLNQLTTYPNLKQLNVSQIALTRAAISALSSLPQLENLDLSNCRGQLLAFSRANITSLRSVSFCNTRFDDRCLMEFASQGITELILAGSNVTDIGLESLRSFICLKSLSVSGRRSSYTALNRLSTLEKISLDSFREGSLDLSEFSRISSLSMTHCRNDSDWLKTIDPMQLKELKLSETTLSPADIAHLERFTRLKSLYLDLTGDDQALVFSLFGFMALEEIGLTYFPITAELQRLAPWISQLSVVSARNSDISDGTVRLVQQSPRLTFLNLQDTKVTDDGLEFSKQCPLRELYLGQTAITDAGVKKLAHLNHLELLGLEETRITDVACLHLAGMTSLRELRLMNTVVSDEGVRAIAQLSNLERLYLNGTTVTDSGLIHLRAMERLRTLWVMDCNVTSQGIERLQSVLPYCYIAS